MNLFNLHFSNKQLETSFRSSLNHSSLQNHLITLAFWALFFFSFAANHVFYREIIITAVFFGFVLILSMRKFSSQFLGFGFVVGLSGSILYSLTAYFKETDFETKFQGFVQGWSFSCFEIMLANQATNLEHKIATLVLSFSLRFGILGGFDPRVLNGGNLFRSFLSEVFLIYVFYRFEKRERSLFEKLHNTQEDFTQLKSIIKQFSSTSIGIIDTNNQRCLFKNKAFSNLLRSADDLSPSFPKFIDFQRSLKIDKNSVSYDLQTFSSHLALNEVLNLNDLIQKLQVNNFYGSKTWHLTASCEIKGSQKYFDITITSVTWNQTPSILLALDNVTYKKEISNLKLAQENQDLLIATVSHELRTPLHGVLGLIQIVEPKIKEQDTLGYLSLCKDNANLLLNLVNSLLDNQQIQHGEIKLNPSQVHIQTFVKSILGLFSFVATQKNLKLNFIIEDDVPPNIITDENRLRQVLINLISNALKFTFSGEITIKVTQSFESQEQLKFSVSDTGRGIKKDDLNKLFKMYTKIEDKEGLNKQGVGLGLTISNNISKLLCNQTKQDGIAVKSEYGIGSTFSFLVHKDINDTPFIEQTPSKLLQIRKGLLTNQCTSTNLQDFEEFSKPIDIKSKLSLYTSSRAVWNISSIRKKSGFMKTEETDDEESFSPQIQGPILVVDDNYFNLLIAKNILESLGYQVQTALSGQEAIEKFTESIKKRLPYACILMDCQMPLMDGFETTGFLKRMMETERVKPVPIVALTASHDKKTIEKCYESGMVEYLCKPLAKEDFMKILCKR